jgi:hypothetical protein
MEQLAAAAEQQEREFFPDPMTNVTVCVKSRLVRNRSTMDAKRAVAKLERHFAEVCRRIQKRRTFPELVEFKNPRVYTDKHSLSPAPKHYGYWWAEIHLSFRELEYLFDPIWLWADELVMDEWAINSLGIKDGLAISKGSLKLKPIEE